MRWRDALALLSLLGAAVIAALWLSARLPDGPVEPHWDHTRCARCGMLISDPAFAAQLQRKDATVLHYDDPGCLLLHEGPERGALSEAHAVWFHHLREPRWLSLEEVAFVPVAHTPMGWGLGAVERTEVEDGLDPERALALLRERERSQP